MLVLDMRQRLQQSLMTHFLQNRGIRINAQENLQATDWPSTVLLTDKPPLSESTPVYGYQIWLLDASGHFSEYLPPQVKGLLISDCDLNELEVCVRQVILHQSYISPGLMTLLSRRPESETAINSVKLTTREQQIFELIKEGLSLRTIAERLFISEHTAENHRANIQKKLALTGRLSLVRYATKAALEGK